MLERMWPVYERCLAEHFAPQLDSDAASTIRSALDRVTDSVRED